MNLIEAIQQKKLEDVQNLLTKGADPNQANSDGLLPMKQAVLIDSWEILEALLVAGGDPDLALMEATKLKQIETIEKLLELGANIEVKDSSEDFLNWTPLMHTARQGTVTLLKLLIRKGANLEAVDNLGKTALIIVAQYGQALLAAPLIEAGADIHHRDNSSNDALAYAYLGKHRWIISKLEAAGASRENSQDARLIEAADSGNLAEVVRLIEAGSDVNVCTSNGYSPLQRACMQGHIAVVEYLIQAGSDINYKGAGFTPLIEASYRGHFEVVKLLVEAGADIHSTAFNKLTAFDYAKSAGHKNVVDYLRRSGRQKM